MKTKSRMATAITAVRPATPTTYSGVEFRSKSEAIFARALDLCGFTNWEYEPLLAEGLMFDSWYRPDFLVWHQLGSMPLNALIEYKPAHPTRTYREQLEDWYQRSGLAMPLIIVYGSPYNDRRGAMRLGCDRWKVATVWYAIARPVLAKLNEAERFRFDLSPAAPIAH